MQALVLRKSDNIFSNKIEDIKCNISLPLLTNVEYSSLNYKDALAITNKSPVVRSWPMVAGIDGAGTIADPGLSGFEAGERVVVTGWGLGETHWGCLASQVATEADWPIKLPASISTRDAMAVGTAGFTAMLCIMGLRRHGLKPEDGPVLVTGASGGVGGMALMFLKSMGYQTVASTGKTEETDYLQVLGASQIVDRAEFSEPGKPLQKERWAGAIDSVGSQTLANVCAQTRYGGIVAACGLAQGMDFPASVAPFILRGITLAGIDSVMAPPALRKEAWGLIACHSDRETLESMTSTIGLDQVFDAAEDLLAGRVRGRLVVEVGR